MITEQQIWTALEEVMDPEIPTISMVDMGIITGVELREGGNSVKVSMTPTFAGCPALRAMETMVKERLELMHISHIEVETTFDIAWTTERITEKGRQALLKHGLAPPEHKKEGYIELDVLNDVACPYCNSRNTTLKSPFGPTLCRALHYCNNCLQAFEQFKPVF